ncbi:MAG: hypothetical protein M1825_005373 [Sarcosagium campestre]|nr:MAG: hypothetical protein M1825_005373 [Sarcosagium campestre]
MPSDIGFQLKNTWPKVDFEHILDGPSPLTLSNLDELNDKGGWHVYLTSREDIQEYPPYLFGVIPDEQGLTRDAVTCAIIGNDRGEGRVDVYYFYFYAYNQGPRVLKEERGTHVGDWEHTMLRFQDGVPQAIWLSQHRDGKAYTYEAIEKDGVRPVIYASKGNHANYPRLGKHALENTRGLITDKTNAGILWNPVLASSSYWFDAAQRKFSVAEGPLPANWLHFEGHWGDQQYPRSDRRQRMLMKIAPTTKYTDGPTGPIGKNLDHSDMRPFDRI